MIDKVGMLSQEALSLAVAMVRDEYNEEESFRAVDRITQIVKEIGGTTRELMLNAQQFVKEQEALNPVGEGK